MVLLEISNFNHTYKHLVSDQGGHNNLMIENVVLGHHVSKLFWMPVVGEELHLAQENVIIYKHNRYAVTVVKDSNITVHVLWSTSIVSWYSLKYSVSIRLK